MSKTLKVTISGSFKASDGDIESFDKVTGIIPALEEEKANQMVIRRYAIIWIGQARKNGPDGKPTEEPKYKRVQKVRQVFIDSIEENDEAPKAELSYVGKDILDMNFEEIQDLAAANDLSGVPLYKTCSLQHARRVAWSEYAIKVLGLEEYLDPKARKPQNIYDHRTMGFNPKHHEPIVADGRIRRSGEHVADIEETIDRENMAMQGKAKATVVDTTKSRLSLDQLKAIADGKGISYHKSIGYEQLYKKIYSAAA